MKIKLKTYYAILLLFIVIFPFCTKDWTDHYLEADSDVNERLWDVLSSSDEFSEFVKYCKLFHLDTIINSDKIKTLFIPTNDAINVFLSEDTIGFKETLQYHIVPTYFMLRNVENNQHHRLRTLEEKFALIQNINSNYYFDGVEIFYSSPMHLDGKYYQIKEVAVPKPNIYEYIKRNNPSIRKYIDLQDSVILDRELSKPVGFNDNGQTVYDSVATVINMFEEKYFAISREYRNIFATVVIPGKEIYENALSSMAQDIGGNYSSFEDIPESWENNVLIPALLHKGVFSGLLQPMDFLTDIMPNVAGDSVIIDFKADPASQIICSNGLVYEYETFSVADHLYKMKMIEGEDFVKEIGDGQYAWIDNKVTIVGDRSFQPSKDKISGASNDTIVYANFESNYQQTYSIKFKVSDVFPQRYRLVWRTNYRTTGVFSIYVNDEIVKLGISGYEQFDTSQLINGFFSVLGYKLYPNSKGFCDLDGWVDNITDFGDITIEIKYFSSGESPENGIVIDYLALESE
ncbi:MAG: fasciclin domain-containing protein [Bacteroidales bacterium]